MILYLNFKITAANNVKAVKRKINLLKFHTGRSWDELSQPPARSTWPCIKYELLWLVL